MVKKQFKLANIILIILFFLVIFSPAVGTLLGLKNVVSESENRNLNEIPQFNFSDQSLADYTKKLEAFLNDHFGFRNQLIKLNNNIVISLFNKSPVKKVLIGKEGWLYSWNEMIIENYYGSHDDRQLREWIKVYEKRRLWLKERGIDFAFVVAPNKMTIYPEYLPRTIETSNHETRLEQLVKVLKENTDVTIVDLRQPLIAAKALNQVYYKTDTHWNYYGAFEAYKYLLKEIFPDLSPMCDSAVSYLLEKASKINNDTTGDLIHMLKGGRRQYPRFYFLENACAKEIDFNNITLATVGIKPRKIPIPEGAPSRYLFFKGCPHEKKRVIVFRDSFFSAVECFFSEHFELVVYIRKKYDPKIMEDLIEKVRPDIVIEEILERYLNKAPLEEIKFYEQNS